MAKMEQMDKMHVFAYENNIKDKMNIKWHFQATLLKYIENQK